jgi:hypothetical protein
MLHCSRTVMHWCSLDAMASADSVAGNSTLGEDSSFGTWCIGPVEAWGNNVE